MEINYKSDFTLDITFNAGGSTIDTPEYDFELKFSTGGVVEYDINYINNKATNCFISDDSIHGIFKDHGLGKGALVCNAILYYPNSAFDGGIQIIKTKYNVGVELVIGEGNEMDTPSLSVSTPTADYNALTNKPQINGVELEGDMSSEDIKLNESFVSIDE